MKKNYTIIYNDNKIVTVEGSTIDNANANLKKAIPNARIKSTKLIKNPK